VRLLLDAHLSGQNVAGPLRAAGHDVRALAEERESEGLDDEQVLTLATQENRILATRDIADFPRLLREWGGAGRSHACVILVYGIGHAEFAVIVRGIERWLERVPGQDEWVDLAVVLDRAFAS
jgi:predicted nuclease of predicted toxin-antitoxin system